MLTILTLAFFLTLPFFDLRLFKRHLAAQQNYNHKPAYYVQLLAELWIPTCVVFVLATTGYTQFADIGLGQLALESAIVPGWVSVGISVLAGLSVAYSLIDLLRLKFDTKYQAAIQRKLHSVKMPAYIGLLLPSTSREKLLYSLVAISAGFTEEILYRGFLTYVLLTSFPALGIWLSILISSLLFGLGHLYQGISGVLQTFIIGLILSLVFLATGSLLPGIIMHMLIDLTGTLIENLEDNEPYLTTASLPN